MQKKLRMPCDMQILRIIAEKIRSTIMAKQNTAKKHIVTSFHNLSAELQDEVKEKYPLGFTDAMMRVDKPNGDFFMPCPSRPTKSPIW